MTTVAWDGSTLAADGRLVDDVIVSDDFRKIFRIRGELVGICGTAAACMALVDWLKAGGEGKQPKCQDSQVLFIGKDGRARVSEGGSTAIDLAVPCAIGSGRTFAMAVMDTGGSARNAVKAAMKRDPNTGGKIRTLRL